MADIVVLLGTISTWIAVLLALAALIGVVGPWKALRTAYTDWNRALDAIHDTQQEFITKGYGIGRAFRCFRRAKVPRLLPAKTSFATYGVPALIPAVNGQWTLEEIRGTKCRTGWPKICRLLEAYSIKQNSDPNNEQTPSSVYALMEQRRGRLVYRHGHAWLPISKHWILAIGLLGRYGDRHDGGRLITPSIRRDLDEERTFVSGNNSGPDLSSVTSDSSTSHVEFSFIPLVSSRRTKISGVTGVIQKLKITRRNEQGLSSPLSFDLHNEDERGHVLSNESCSLETLFWLAEGFLPDLQRNEMIYSLEDPILDPYLDESTDNQPCLDGTINSQKHRLVIRLTPSRDRPRSLRLAMEAFRLQRTRVSHWLEGPTNTQERLFATDCLGLPEAFMIRDELETMVYAFLDLRWTPSSFLIWKKNTKLWTTLLLRTAPLIHLLLSTVWTSEDLEPGLSDPRELDDYRRWKDMTRFNQRKSRDLHLLDELLFKASRQTVQLNDIIATLIITNTAFQDRVRQLADNFDKDAEPITVYVSIECVKDVGSNMACVSWNGEESFMTSCPTGFQFDLVEVSQADLLLAALRAATRCAMWTTALDSKPLLDFVGSLKNIAYIA